MPIWSSDVVTDGAALARLEPEWWDLWGRCPAATPFGAPAWALPWWSAFGPGTLATVAVRREGRLVGLAPAYLESGEQGRRVLPIGIGITDHLDVLLDPCAGPEAGLRLGEAMRRSFGWGRWDLEELAPDAAALDLPVPSGCREERSDHSACPVLDPLDLALSAVPSRQRRKIRMARHRVARRSGRIESQRADGVAAFFDVLAGLHGARWAERGETGVLADPRVAAFHRAALPRLAKAGLLHATTLIIEDRVAAAYYGLAHGRSAYAYLGGFDPAFAFESPGTVLLADALEAAAQAGATAFHFLRGREPYKYAWGATDRINRKRSFLSA